MKTTRMQLAALLAALSLVLCGAGLAQAAATGLHMGASVGWNFFDIGGDLDDAVDFSEDDDLGWELVVGYRFSAPVAIEVGYVDMGEVEGRASTSGGGGGAGESEELEITADAKGFLGRVVGYLPLIDNCLELTGSAGAFFYDSDVAATLGDSRNSESYSGTAPTLGLGLLYRVHEQILLGIGYDHYFGIEDVDINTVKATVVFEDW